MGNQYAKQQAETLQNAARFNQENASKVAAGAMTVGAGWGPPSATSSRHCTFTIYGAPAYSLVVKAGPTASSSLTLNCMSKVDTIPDEPGALQISALKKVNDGSTLTVDLKAKVDDAAAAAEFCDGFKNVVATFHSRVGARELEDGVVLREGWLKKYPKIGRAQRRFFCLAKTVEGTKIDSFLSLYYFVDEKKNAMKGMYPVNKYCKATVGTDPTKFVWESQHVNKAGKATDQIRVELQADNAVQATSWANLINFLANMDVPTPEAGEQAPELPQPAEQEPPASEVTEAFAAGRELGSQSEPTADDDDEDLAIRLAEAAGMGAALANILAGHPPAAVQPNGGTSDIDRAFLIGQTEGNIARAFSLGHTKGAQPITSDAGASVNPDIKHAFLIGQTEGGIERAFARGQTAGAAAIASDADTSVDPHIERAFFIGQTEGGIERAFARGQTAGAAAITSDADTSVDPDIKRAFLIGQTEGGIERAFSLGQSAGLEPITSDADTSVDSDIERAFSLGQIEGGIERALSLGQSAGAAAITSDADTSVDEDIKRAFSLGYSSV